MHYLFSLFPQNSCMMNVSVIVFGSYDKKYLSLNFIGIDYYFGLGGLSTLSALRIDIGKYDLHPL